MYYHHPSLHLLLPSLYQECDRCVASDLSFYDVSPAILHGHSLVAGFSERTPSRFAQLKSRSVCLQEHLMSTCLDGLWVDRPDLQTCHICVFLTLGLLPGSLFFRSIVKFDLSNDYRPPHRNQPIGCSQPNCAGVFWLRIQAHSMSLVTRWFAPEIWSELKSCPHLRTTSVTPTLSWIPFQMHPIGSWPFPALLTIWRFAFVLLRPPNWLQRPSTGHL